MSSFHLGKATFGLTLGLVVLAGACSLFEEAFLPPFDAAAGDIGVGDEHPFDLPSAPDLARDRAPEAQDIEGGEGDSAPGHANECGGTAELEGSLGDACGPCGLGNLECNDPDYLVCVDLIGEYEYWLDFDGDGFGDPESDTVFDCALPDGYVENDFDCDDTRGTANPDADEVCNGLDDNCADGIDEDEPGAGLPCNTGRAGICAAGTTACDEGSPSCIQNQSSSGEVCDGLNNDCDGATDESGVCTFSFSNVNLGDNEDGYVEARTYYITLPVQPRSAVLRAHQDDLQSSDRIKVNGSTAGYLSASGGESDVSATLSGGHFIAGRNSIEIRVTGWNDDWGWDDHRLTNIRLQVSP